jgi:hypothetical protein
MGDFMMSRTFPYLCHNINVVNPNLFPNFASDEGCEPVFLCLRFMPLAVWNRASNDLSLSRGCRRHDACYRNRYVPKV